MTHYDMGFTDLHSHILPGLDDGARDRAMSTAMIGALADLGFDAICATPHQKAGQYLPSREAIDEAFAATRATVAERGLGVSLHLGAENMWDDVFFGRSQAEAIPSYDGGPAFLLEFRPHELPVGLFEHLFRIQSRGKLPVIAHPERYLALQRSSELVDKLAARCAMVVDLCAVSGHYGRAQARTARRMLRRGVVHAAASDLHSPDDARGVSEGMAWIRKKLGGDALTRLCGDNPRMILAGRHPG